jgi:hypothetical protein
VVLPHTALRVPHERLRVTGLGRAFTPAGVSYRAAVAWDGEPTGTIVNDGAGGPSTLRPAIPPHIRRFLDACRRSGQPASDGQILDCLVEEYAWARQVSAAADDGGALARLIDADATILTSLVVWPAPRNPVARMNVGAQVAARHHHPRGVRWQIWNGTTWQHLAPATPTTDSPTPHRNGDDPVNPMEVIAYLIADGLLDRLDRDQLIKHAADTGVPLTPSMSDPQLRAAIRDDSARRARLDGLPVDDLPTLSADQAIELGRTVSGGGSPDAGTIGPQLP